MNPILNGFSISYGPGGWDRSLSLTYMIMVESRLKLTKSETCSKLTVTGKISFMKVSKSRTWRLIAWNAHSTSSEI